MSLLITALLLGFAAAQLVKNLPAMRETWVRSLGWEDHLEKGESTQSSILAWRISWTIQSMGSQRVGLGSTTFTLAFPYFGASLVAQSLKRLPAVRETWVQSLGWEDPLEKEKSTLSSILAWRIPWTIQSMGSQRVRHD